jgi:hypothetical protein
LAAPARCFQAGEVFSCVSMDWTTSQSVQFICLTKTSTAWNRFSAQLVHLLHNYDTIPSNQHIGKLNDRKTVLVIGNMHPVFTPTISDPWHHQLSCITYLEFNMVVWLGFL